MTGQRRALFFDDFQDAPPPPTSSRLDGLRRARSGDSGYLSLEPGVKMIAGDTEWTDYVLEGRVMLKSDGRGNAGLVFRVNDPGPGHDQMRGYYVGLDTHKTLPRQNGKQLAAAGRVRPWPSSTAKCSRTCGTRSAWRSRALGSACG